jgi:hypothetical protein
MMLNSLAFDAATESLHEQSGNITQTGVTEGFLPASPNAYDKVNANKKGDCPKAVAFLIVARRA